MTSVGLSIWCYPSLISFALLCLLCILLHLWRVGPWSLFYWINTLLSQLDHVTSEEPFGTQNLLALITVCTECRNRVNTALIYQSKKAIQLLDSFFNLLISCCRYKPSEETFKQIDRFCVNIIAECNVNPSRRSASWSQPSSQQSGASSTTTNIPLPVSNYASLALVKSLDYVRSLVAQNMPKRSFQPAAFAGAPSARQSLPSLSSLLSKSFNSQLSPATNKESSENKEASALSVSNSPIAEESDGMDDLEFIALDVLKWRWCRDGQSSLLSSKR